MTSHAVYIDVRIDGDQITGHVGVGLSQPEPFLGWLGFVGALDRPMGSSTEGPVPGSAAAMGSTGRQTGAGRGSGQ